MEEEQNREEEDVTNGDCHSHDKLYVFQLLSASAFNLVCLIVKTDTMFTVCVCVCVCVCVSEVEVSLTDSSQI